MVSTLLVVASLVITPMKDPRGVDLKGGDLLTIHSVGEVTTQKIDQTLQEKGLNGFYVQKQQAMGAGGEFVTIRSQHGSGKQIQEILKEDLEAGCFADRSGIGGITGRLGDVANFSVGTWARYGGDIAVCDGKIRIRLCPWSADCFGP